MKKIFIFIVCTVLTMSAVRAQVKISGGPYLQDVTDTSFTVIWTTNMDAVGWIEVAPDDGTHFYNTERKAYYDKRGLGRKPIGKMHKVTVSGLEPGTSYRYRAMNKGVLSQEHRTRIVYTEGYGQDILKHNPPVVTTLKKDWSSVKFAVVNDVHENDSTFRELFKDARGKYDFVCFNGDMTSEVRAEEDIMKYYMKSASELFADQTPIYMVRGNHEYRGNDAIRYLDYMQTPTGKTYYTFSYGDFFFIVLDSGEDKPDSDIRNLGIMITEDYVKEEAEWLEKVTESEAFRNAASRIVFCHMPPGGNGWHGNAMVSRYFVPVLNRAGIDLMLCAHIHRYRYDAPGTLGNDFPVLCNDNLTRLDAEVTPDRISINIYDASGKAVKSQTFQVGK